MSLNADSNSMSFTIDDSPLGRRREDELDLATAPDYQLLFSCFLGAVQLRLGGIDFSTHGSGLATLSFALGFARRVGQLPEVPQAMVTFQESGGGISMVLEGDDVRISASYVEEIGVVPYGQLRLLARDGLVDLLAYLDERYPALSSNPAFTEPIETVMQLIR